MNISIKETKIYDVDIRDYVRFIKEKITGATELPDSQRDLSNEDPISIAEYYIDQLESEDFIPEFSFSDKDNYDILEHDCAPCEYCELEFDSEEEQEAVEKLFE